jgi:predicted transcriptional regulator
MARTVSARVNEEVAEWLEDYAETRKTTKARIVEEQVLELYREVAEEDDDQDELRLGDVEQIVEGDTEIILRTGDLDVSRELREMFEEHLAESDDARLKEVRFAGDTPDSVVRDAWGHAQGRMDA